VQDRDEDRRVHTLRRLGPKYLIPKQKDFEKSGKLVSSNVS
jgi:hypothetical protein